jgi:hypothetical protein
MNGNMERGVWKTDGNINKWIMINGIKAAEYHSSHRNV